LPVANGKSSGRLARNASIPVGEALLMLVLSTN